MKRQSSVLFASAAADDRVAKAMLRIETLTSDLNEQETRYQNEVVNVGFISRGVIYDENLYLTFNITFFLL